DISRARQRSRAEPREIARGGSFGALSVVGDDVITTESTIRRPAEVVAIPRDGGRRRTITGFTTPIMKTIDVGRVQDLTFTGARGEKIQTFLIHPPDSAPGSKSKPRPLVHLVHGGPHGAFSDDWHYRWNPQMYAARGYLVAMVNFHGSVGWGHEFARSIRGSWGELPAEDIARVTDALVARRLADPRRMALAGASYGGYLVSWIASQTDRYACIVNHAGVCDFQTQFASDFTQGWPQSAGGDLWSDRDGLDRFSPIRHAHGFRSPMLVLHGERDYRVPADQARTIYGVYRAMKKPARLVVYPDENHWILKPRNSRHWHGEVFDWLDRWLKRAR
ncbi:MAG: prolyl oligopeptidase family serine peptidase, partial [Phycisphaerae bacterium]|nr:prolyl oligopeptidase family serine peptidase [Phycisphaerae bacterium]